MDFLYPKESFIIRGAAFNVYKNLGSGHKERIYHSAYLLELIDKGLAVEKEKRIDIFY
jgi:GxxExxY protein